MLKAVNSSNRLSLIKSYHSRSNVQPCLCFRLLLLKEQVRSQCNVPSNCSTLLLPLFFFFLFYRLLRVRLPIAEMESEFSSRSTSPSSLNLSACPNHASIDHVAPLTRPKGNVISREGEGRFPKGRFSPFIPSTRILISSMMFGEVIFRQICVRVIDKYVILYDRCHRCDPRCLDGIYRKSNSVFLLCLN